MPATATVKRSNHRNGGIHTAVRKKPEQVSERHRLPRSRSLVNDVTDVASTIGARMTQRRVELDLTQEYVADHVTFTPKSGAREGDEVTLSRNAYCMYEIGSVIPKIGVIAEIAKALDCSPAWIAFGIPNAPVIREYTFDAKKGFVPMSRDASNGGWVLNADWLKQKFNGTPDTLGLYMLSDFAESFVAGDMVIFEKDAMPTVAGGTFIFAHKGQVKIAHLTHPVRSDNVRIFTTDLRKHVEAPLKQITLLGRVVGKTGSLSR